MSSQGQISIMHLAYISATAASRRWTYAQGCFARKYPRSARYVRNAAWTTAVSAGRASCAWTYRSTASARSSGIVMVALFMDVYYAAIQ
jgi:hypothetical protein